MPSTNLNNLNNFNKLTTAVQQKVSETGQRANLNIKSNLKQKSDEVSSLCDPAGIRTQDPYIKSVLLYQLSYGISKDSKFESDPAGIRTQDPYIKSVLLYQLSYGILQS
jgi:hypothetical protein